MQKIIKLENVMDNRWLVINDDGTQEHAIMPAIIKTVKQAESKWAQMQQELETEYVPVQNKREMMKEIFFDVMIENIEKGNLDVTLKDVVRQVDTRIKGKSKK